MQEHLGALWSLMRDQDSNRDSWQAEEGIWIGSKTNHQISEFPKCFLPGELRSLLDPRRSPDSKKPVTTVMLTVVILTGFWNILMTIYDYQHICHGVQHCSTVHSSSHGILGPYRSLFWSRVWKTVPQNAKSSQKHTSLCWSMSIMGLLLNYEDKGHRTS